MSILHPIRNQFEGLAATMQEQLCIPLNQAAKAMGIKPNQVAQSLVKMDQKGFFADGDVPYVESSVNLVVRDHRYAAFAVTYGNITQVHGLLSRAELLVPEYQRWQNRFKSSTNAQRVGKAVLNFAQGVLDGKRVADNLRNSTRFFYDDDQKTREQGPDMATVLKRLNAYAEQLHTYVCEHPGNVYPEELRTWLITLRRTLESWNTAIPALFSSEQAGAAAEIAGKRLSEKYMGDFPQMMEIAKKKPVASSSLEEVQRALVNSMTYLNRVDDQITDMRVRAAVIRIRAQLNEINELYTVSDDNYSRSDARSLRNSYLPMLNSLVERYMTWQFAQGNVGDPNYRPDETVRVLENDLPAALNHIREELRKGETMQMESEASALRQKLEMDGLI